MICGKRNPNRFGAAAYKPEFTIGKPRLFTSFVEIPIPPGSWIPEGYHYIFLACTNSVPFTDWPALANYCKPIKTFGYAGCS